MEKQSSVLPTRRKIGEFISGLVDGDSDYEARMKMQDVLMEVLFFLSDSKRLEVMQRVALMFGKAQIFGRRSDFVVYMTTEYGQEGISCAVTTDQGDTYVGAEPIEFLFAEEATVERLKNDHKFSGENLGYANFRDKEWQIKSMSGKTEYGISTMSVSLVPVKKDVTKFGLLPDGGKDPDSWGKD